MTHPRPDTKTHRRALRQEIRHWLGVGRDEAPSLAALLIVANRLNKLIRLTTNDRYGVVVTDGHGDYLPGKAELETAARDWRES